MHVHLPPWLDRRVYESWTLEKDEVQVFIRRLRWLGFVDALVMVPNGPLFDVWRFNRITVPELKSIVEGSANGIVAARVFCLDLHRDRKGESFYRIMTVDEVRIGA